MKPVKVLEEEIIRILTVWKYIKGLISLLNSEFIISCRLLQKLAKGILNHHIKKFPLWLRGLMTGWFIQIERSICKDI